MIETHYKSILSKSEKVLSELSTDPERMSTFTSAHNAAEDLDSIASLLIGRPEAAILRLALVEYQHSLYSAAFGQYRQAHVSLRLFLELCLTTVLFSAHEVDCRLWLSGTKDINWSSIVSKDSGVFAKTFVKVFFEGMQEHSSQYCAMAEILYRECSEFVHGNRQSYDGLDSGIIYLPKILVQWADRADTALRVVLFCFTCRYLKLSDLRTRNKLEQLILNYFSDLTPIQALYEEVPT